MQEIMQYVQEHWQMLSVLLLLIADKIVAATPCKWDDLILTAIKSFFSGIKKASGGGPPVALIILLLPLFLGACATSSGNVDPPMNYEDGNTNLANEYYKARAKYEVFAVEAYDDKPGIKKVTFRGPFPDLQYFPDKWSARIDSVAGLVGKATPAVVTGLVVDGFKAGFEASGSHSNTSTVEVGSRNRQNVTGGGDGATATAQMPAAEYAPSRSDTVSKGDSWLDLF